MPRPCWGIGGGAIWDSIQFWRTSVHIKDEVQLGRGLGSGELTVGRLGLRDCCGLRFVPPIVFAPLIFIFPFTPGAG